MKLLQCSTVLHNQIRHSRNSVIQFRKRRSILKEFRVERSDPSHNVYHKLNSPIDKLVPIDAQKTSITIDILGEETYPKLSDWRREQLVKRARRVLPLPLSLTTDEQVGRIWKQRFISAIRKKLDDSYNAKEKLLSQVPDFVRLMLEKDPELLKNAFPEIYAKFQELSTWADQVVELEKLKSSDIVPYFPFRNEPAHFKPEDERLILEEDNEKELLDEEYEKYLKHHEVLQYFASTLKQIPHREFEPEIEGWSSQMWLRDYGKPDPAIPPSKIPCSGCGAHLHCVATNIPGFMPSEKFSLFSESELHTQLCQRCDFLQKYNVALNVTVPADEYPKLISKIQNKRSLVIIMVDLLDFPCSVWPGIINLIGEKHSIYIVGNKVDLLPKDSKFYLENVKKSLKESLKQSGIGRNTKIRDISLISSKTGFGIENLVTKLLRDLKKGEDIHLLGCTNSGKSTLFNVLMQTDLCALRDSDLMTRATTSLWPGTTLNLLKFPVGRLTGWMMQMRLNRLNMEEKKDIAERRLKWTMHRQEGNPPFATLMQRIGSTFRNNLPIQIQSDHPLSKSQTEKRPFDPNNAHFKECSSLFDTPGVIYKDQLLNLLTTEELLKTVPREIITPRTYSLKPNQSLFIGGLARIDLMHARQHVWLTIFASRYLPVNIVYTEQAKKFYDLYVGTEVLAVPFGGHERLERWPNLLPNEITLKTIGWEESCADIVLSSAGWASVTAGKDTQCVLRAFTPEGRGIFVRNPPLLPYASKLRGKKIYNTPCFENKLYTVDDLTEGAIPRSFKRYDKTDHISEERIKKAIQFVGDQNDHSVNQ